MALYLSKSTYCSGVQCPKMLWLSRYKEEAFDSSLLDHTAFEIGNQLGEIARGLFGAYTEVPCGDFDEMIGMTARLMAEGVPVIAEASFSINGLFCRVDILRNLGGGMVELYEVKSSVSVKKVYYDDVAYQVYVLEQLGYHVQRACLVHVNSHYVRHGELDIHRLFTLADLTDKVLAMQAGVQKNISRLEVYLQQPAEPAQNIGEHCFSPYDCGFWKYCNRHLPSPNVFDITGLKLSAKCKCYEKGLVSFADLMDCDLLSAKQHQQVEHEVFKFPPFADVNAIRNFLKGLAYPVYFLDFETFQPPIPLFEAARPFEQIVFQYSLHYLEKDGGELKHKEYLAHPGTDPRRPLAEQLCRDIPKDVCVIAYNMSFEKGRIKGLAELFPDLADHLLNIHDHIQDLMIPFQQRQYYDKAMQGSHSIKYVLPALFPDDPGLDYHYLKGIHNGAEASAAYAAMAYMAPDDAEETRAHLLEYCGLDTFAMVKIWQKLHEAAGISLKITW